MARATQYRDIRIVDGTGSAKLGAVVELKRGAVTVGMTEVGDGYYKNDAAPVGQWAVYVGALDTGRTIAVGAGEVDAPDYENNPNSIMVTDATGNPQWGTAPLADGKIFVGNASGDSAPVDMSGDATILNTGAVTIANNAVSDAKFRDSSALSVVGRSTNSLGDVGDIAASTDGDILRRSGSTLGFGTVPVASVDGLQSSLDDKLPLAGGTLTGALNGTTASFTGSVTVGANITQNGDTHWIKRGGNESSYYRLGEDGSYRGAVVGYDGGSNKMFLATHETNDELPANDIRFMEISRGSQDVDFLANLYVTGSVTADDVITLTTAVTSASVANNSFFRDSGRSNKLSYKGIAGGITTIEA